MSITDRRTDRLKLYSADMPTSIELKAYTDFQMLTAPMQIRLVKVNLKVDLQGGPIKTVPLHLYMYITQMPLNITFVLSNLCEYRYK